mgnify:CR=1 FL=1
MEDKVVIDILKELRNEFLQRVEELEETLTGMDYIPYTPENAERLESQKYIQRRSADEKESD